MMSEMLVIPDRYEVLERYSSDELASIVVPVEDGLDRVAQLSSRMRIAGRGAFLILRGSSGIGKTTFLHTLKFFKEGVTTRSIPDMPSLRSFFKSREKTLHALDVYVLEDREAAVNFEDREIEEWLHAINSFIRSENGSNCLVVWPANTDDLCDRIIDAAQRIGAETLIGGDDRSVFRFEGPAKSEFSRIAANTLAVLNQGASFSDLGLTLEDVERTATSSDTLGRFFSRLQDAILAQEESVRGLVDKERCRLWIIVVAGNDPQAEIAGLTRGRSAAIDTERLLTSTGANVVADLRKYPQKLGMVGTVLDTRILHLPVLTALALVRAFADDGLKSRMSVAGLKLKPDGQMDALDRLQNTELATVFQDGTQGPLSRGPKLGPSSIEAFGKLAEIASKNDQALNRALANGLKQARLIRGFEIEKPFRSHINLRTDIAAQTDYGMLRLEIMWRRTTGRADIANYALTKLANYAKAIDYLK